MIYLLQLILYYLCVYTLDDWKFFQNLSVVRKRSIIIIKAIYKWVEIDLWLIRGWFQNVVSPHSSEAAVELQYLWVSMHTGRVEVLDSKTIEAPCSREGHIGLSIFKHPWERDLHTVQRHPLALVNGDGPCKLEGELSSCCHAPPSQMKRPLLLTHCLLYASTKLHHRTSWCKEGMQDAWAG